jgi:Subtilase family
MPDKPILIFPAATVAARQSAGGGAPGPAPRPSKGSQGQRLAARFQSLGTEFGTAQTVPDGVDPEQVIVLETIGSFSDFQNVVKKIVGMEWLGDFDAEVAAGDPGFLADGADPALQKARLFVLASNRTAYTEVLNLWNQWQQAANDKLPYGYGALAEAFKYLNDVRAWGPKDRVLATGIAAYWAKGLASNDPTIRFEAELWCRADAAKRDAAFARLQAIVNGAGGQCVKQAALPDIDYHGVLIELPAAVVRQTVDAINAGNDTQLLRLTDVKYFAPMGQASITPIDDGTVVTPPNRPGPTGDPVVAILDGLPLTNHAALQGRLVVDDPDNLAASYQAGEHRHGTAMASLVVHAEYDGNEPALGSKVYMRPVMAPGRPDTNNRRWETFPPNELAVDLMHRAVRRMFEADGATPPQAASVKVINLSLGDVSQPFDRQLSPWARLLDWLAFKYQVLFVVSAGNPGSEITIPAPPASIAGMSDDDLRSHTLRSMAQQRVQRRLLAPAESINALTVGALHTQSSPHGNLGALVDVLRGADLPSPGNPVASGFRRSVKPEILVPGGRLHLERQIAAPAATNAVFSVTNAPAQPGQLVAACHPARTSNQHAARACGSSNAAALTTRRAAQIVERLRELQAEPGGAALTDARMAVILKAMLVHGASWGDRYALFDQVFNGPDNGLERWWRIKRACAQFLGYGPADFDRGILCTDQRVIVLGCGELKAEAGHVYNVPLPPALNAQTVKRRLTITLAWFTPINPRHRSYRVADLWFDPPSTRLSVKRTDADHDAVTRGTVQHEVLEGMNAVPIVDGDTMPVQVNCRPEAASKINAPVPYALLVSLETAQPLTVSIYTQVKAKIDALHVPVPVRATGGNRPRPR